MDANSINEGGDVFRALADPSRRQLLDSLNADNGQTLRELCAGLEMARQSVSKHLAVLEAAGVVTTARRGREKLHYLNPVPINEIADRWITRYDRHRIQALADLKSTLEEHTMPKPEFVYTSYIRTTPEQLWRALTEPSFQRRYWSCQQESDWHVGSTMTWQNNGVEIADAEQVVLEYDPFSRLSYTWHTFTPELASALSMSGERVEKAMAEPRSKVTFQLEPAGEQVKLTVVHDGFEADSVLVGMVGNGWPIVISKLKTVLETEDAIALAG